MKGKADAAPPRGGPGVARDHYFGDYDNLSRFVGYYYQCRSALDLEPDTVLEIGVGNKTAANYLKQRGLKVTTCDSDGDLQPDFVADVRDLACFADDSFDVVMACEVLEHIPWGDVDGALKEIRRVARKAVVISLPCSCWPLCLSGVFPMMKRLLKKDHFSVVIRVPRFFLKPKGVEGHRWEIGSRGYPMKKVKARLRAYFDLRKDFPHAWNAYRHFFILGKDRREAPAGGG